MRFEQNWASLFDSVVAGYLDWKYGSSPPDNALGDEAQGCQFEIDTLDIFSLRSTLCITRPATCISPALALVSHGFLACSPTSPTLAISFPTLELFHRVRLRKPSFSVEAFTKVVLDFYNVSDATRTSLNLNLIFQRPYRRTYRQQMTNAFELYLKVLRHVDHKVQEVLARTSENWRVLNACPPCCYEVCSFVHGNVSDSSTQLEDEPDLRYRRMFAIDGNNSLSRIAPLADRVVGDTRAFTSDYFLDVPYVNEFADIVPPSTSAPSDDSPPSDNAAKCTDNWKAAADDAKKKTWSIFAETGIFASACRHGMILWIADMVRSGELYVV